MRFFAALCDRWNQNLRSNAPSETSMRSKWRMRSMRSSNAARFSCPSTRCRIGSVYHDPKRIPMWPLGGSTRQKRHISGRSRSASLISPKANVRMWRGSIHSFRRFTVSPFPAPSTPFTRMMTGNLAPASRRYCRSSRRWRSFGTSRLNWDLPSLWPISADSNTLGLLEPGLAMPRKVDDDGLEHRRIDALPRGEPAARVRREGLGRRDLLQHLEGDARIVAVAERLLERLDRREIGFEGSRLVERGEGLESVAQALGEDAHAMAVLDSHRREREGAAEEALLAFADIARGEIHERFRRGLRRLRAIGAREPSRDLEERRGVSRRAQRFARLVAFDSAPARGLRTDRSRERSIGERREHRGNRARREDVPVARAAEGAARLAERIEPFAGAALADLLPEHPDRGARSPERDTSLVHEFRIVAREDAFFVRLQLFDPGADHDAGRLDRGDRRMELHFRALHGLQRPAVREAVAALRLRYGARMEL